MAYYNKGITTKGNSTQIELASFVTEIAKYIKNFFVQIEQEQVEARHQLNRNRQMKKQIYQDAIGQMTVEQKLKMGIYRF